MDYGNEEDLNALQAEAEAVGGTLVFALQDDAEGAVAKLLTVRREEHLLVLVIGGAKYIVPAADLKRLLADVGL